MTQTITIFGRDYRFDLIENKDHSGIDPNQKEIVKQMQLNLEAIRYACEPHKSKKKEKDGVTPKKRTPDEIFMLSQMAPATHAKHIVNDYVLNVNIKYDAINCCSTMPSCSIPLTVIPLTNMDTYGFPEPQGYKPFELGYFKFNVH